MLDFTNITIKGIAEPVISQINNFLTILVPQNEPKLVFAIGFYIAYIVKKENDWNWLSFVVMGLVIYSAMRFIGLGG